MERYAETFQGPVEPEGVVAGSWNPGRIIFRKIRFHIVLLLNLWWVWFRRRSWSKSAPLINIEKIPRNNIKHPK